MDRDRVSAPHLIVTRNLESIYDIPTALRAFTLLLQDFPQARLSVAGSGPERKALEALTQELGIATAVTFTGRLDIAEMTTLYQSADLVINPSKIDNMPNSVLEALASGVPVVSTDVGGVPYIVQHAKTACLVPSGQPKLMAEAAIALLRDPVLAQTLIHNGLALVQRYAWQNVRELWLSTYQSLVRNADSAVPAGGKQG
jgi:glycosyltransferase involved in cell wall biosynthesis